VTTEHGSATSATDLVVVRRPTVTSFAPALGPVGTVVTVVGPNLGEVTGVQFNGVAVGVTPVSATSLRAIVPRGATTGLITLLTPAGNVNSLTPFTVTSPSDLRVTAVTAPPSVGTGRPLSLSMTVRNTGGSPVPASTLRLYMSADEALDQGDRLLTTRTIGNVGVGAAVTLTTPTTVPADLAPGSYRILAIIEIAGGAPEGDATNNLGVSGPVSVALYRPDLVVAALMPPVRGAAGQPITVQNTVRNTGPAPAGAFAIRFHLSADAVLDASDPVIGTRTVGGLGAGMTSTASTILRLPAATEVGTYYVIAAAGALAQPELDETNNVAAAGPVAIVLYQPELALTALTVPARWGIGQTLEVANTVRNAGTAPASAFGVRFYLSADTTLDAGDLLVGTRVLSALGAGAASPAQISLRLPVTTREGEYYLIAVVDAVGQQVEQDEANNVTVSAPFSAVPYRPLTPVEQDECNGGMRAMGWHRPAACAPRAPNDPTGGDGDV
jgi:hypothetical protein